MKARAINDRRAVRSWIIYDLANTIFALGVIGLYFPDWLTSIDQPDSVLAVVEATAGVIVVFVAPWAGARSDVKGTRVRTLAYTTVVAVAATALLGISVPSSAIFLAVEQARKGAHHRGAGDRAAVMKPYPVRFDLHVAVVDIIGGPLLYRRQAAFGHRLGNLGERHSGEFWGRSIDHR